MNPSRCPGGVGAPESLEKRTASEVLLARDPLRLNPRLSCVICRVGAHLPVQALIVLLEPRGGVALVLGAHACGFALNRGDPRVCGLL